MPSKIKLSSLLIKLEKNINLLKKNGKLIGKRCQIITKDMIGMQIQVYNGKSYEIVLINSDMLGYKLGEFVFTRELRENIHIKKKKKKK